MSSESDGEGVAGGLTTGAASLSYAEVVNAAKRREVPRDKDFVLTCDQSVPLDVVVDAVIVSANPPQELYAIQQINDKKFIISFKSSAAAAAYNRQGAPNLRIPGATSVCKWLGVDIKRIRVSYLPTAIDNKKLEEVLTDYGRVIKITDEVYAGKPVVVKTGTRLVDFEMARPVPNLITVCGYTVPAVYKGVVIQCRRCLREGHLKADCNTDFCARCKTFGHSEANCEVPRPNRGAAGQGTKACTVPGCASEVDGGGQLGHDNKNPVDSVPPAGQPTREVGVSEPAGTVAGHAESSQKDSTAMVTSLNSGTQVDGNVPLVYTTEVSESLKESDTLPGRTDAHGVDNDGQSERVQAPVATSSNKEEPADAANNDAKLIRSYDAAAASRNFAWHIMQTRSSKRRLSSLTPGISPAAKKPLGNP